MNPYCRLNLYSPDVIDEYENRGLKEMPPHVYNIAQNAITGIKVGTAGCAHWCLGERGSANTTFADDV